MVRFKSRWVLFQIACEPTINNGQVEYLKSPFEIDEKTISRIIFQALEVNYGEFGRGLGSVAVKWYNPITRIGILRVPRDYTDVYLTSMFYMKQILSTTCNIHILHVSGTIILIQQKAIEWDRLHYLKEQAEAESKGDTYSSIDKIEASRKAIEALQ